MGDRHRGSADGYREMAFRRPEAGSYSAAACTARGRSYRSRPSSSGSWSELRHGPGRLRPA
jgi:hypothetical protein